MRYAAFNTVTHYATCTSWIIGVDRQQRYVSGIDSKPSSRTTKVGWGMSDLFAWNGKVWQLPPSGYTFWMEICVPTAQLSFLHMYRLRDWYVRVLYCNLPEVAAMAPRMC